ncbi:cytochrome b [Siculibacillus lacustris]|uniref:Cytochrome b n=1 Tax=Siculibacillus lacustris TaxID=1549641 RepID=A0A4Q9VST6_9HYPH|nr:cytochrome b [Siculibacillus lacustris]TBW38726.1 cytochrome b [Siculibacillus lacustris]
MFATDRSTSWAPGAKFFHWTSALCVVAAWILGLTIDAWPKGAVFVHESLGLAVILMLVGRVVGRLVWTSPEPEQTPWEPWARKLAAAGHGVLYLLLAAVTLLGVGYVLRRGISLSVFGLFQIPSPFVWPDRETARLAARPVKELHELAAHALMAVALLHAVAGLGHHYWLKDRTLTRMLPFRRG